jgi:chaperonin cofactor prefoldin
MTMSKHDTHKEIEELHRLVDDLQHRVDALERRNVIDQFNEQIAAIRENVRRALHRDAEVIQLDQRRKESSL